MTESEEEKFEQIVQAFKDYPDADLTEWEKQFMQDQVDRLEKYGVARVRVSEKQWDILDRIFGKMPI